MTLSRIIRSSINEVIEVILKPPDEAANSSVMKVDPVEAKEDASSKEDEDDVSEEEDDASEEDDDEEASASDEDNASDVDSASEEDIALVLGGLKTRIEEDDALMLGVKKYNHVKVDAELDPILRTPDDLVTRFNKKPREGTIGETSDGLATKHNKRLREETIVAEELKNYVAEIKAKDKPFGDRIGRNKRLREETIDAEEFKNYVAEINAKIKARDISLSLRIVGNIIKHLRPFLAEINGVRMKNVVSAEDAAADLNAYEEAFVVSIARMVVKNLTPCLAEILEECRRRQM
ncbi:hypothetical protein A2U01_0004658, partial [Trifolium medium]|nr:hypothetical protein [Trifolium medium]